MTAIPKGGRRRHCKQCDHPYIEQKRADRPPGLRNGFCTEECDEAERRENKVRHCRQCDSELPDHKGKTGPKPTFCSPKCQRDAMPPKIRRVCVICGKGFGVKYPGDPKQTCSYSCRAYLRESKDDLKAARRVRVDAEREARLRRCSKEGCENRVSNTLARYCSPHCHYTDPDKRTATRSAPTLVFVCETCGETFERKKGTSTGRWCSQKCNRTSRAKGAPPVVPVAVIPPEPIYPRSKWEEGECPCVICGVPGQRHHIVYAQHVVAASPRHRWDVRNRLGVCFAHHTAHHSPNGPKLELGVLPDSVYGFALEILGPGPAHNYLRRHYAGEDPRLVALERVYLAANHDTERQAA